MTRTASTTGILPSGPPPPLRPSRGRSLMVGGLCIVMAVLAGCASRSGGYYKDDGPGARIPANIEAIPDAVPRLERHAPANFRPYEVFGVRYTPIGENQSYRQEGVASWYGRKFHGEKTANGETYDMYAMTAAHPTLPLPSYAKVTSQVNGRSVIVRINDRGPFHPGRIIDLSYVAAAKLGLIGPGRGRVLVQAITNADIRAGRAPGAPLMAAAEPMADTPQANPVSAPAAFAVAPAPVPASMAAATMAGGGIYLQFGAFSSADNAQALAQRVNAQIDDSLGQVSVSHQPPLYKVRMGPFPSRDQAYQTASALSDSAGMNPVVALDQGL